MSLTVKTIDVCGQKVTLRLTSRSLLGYCKKHGTDGGSPVIAVLEAVNNIEAKADLFTSALNHPDNHNQIKDGCGLLDLMADDPAWNEPTAKNALILDLAHDAGLLDDEDYSALVEPVAKSSKTLIDAMARLLEGKPIDGDAADKNADNQENSTEENPT